MQQAQQRKGTVAGQWAHMSGADSRLYLTSTLPERHEPFLHFSLSIRAGLLRHSRPEPPARYTR